MGKGKGSRTSSGAAANHNSARDRAAAAAAAARSNDSRDACKHARPVRVVARDVACSITASLQGKGVDAADAGGCR